MTLRYLLDTSIVSVPITAKPSQRVVTRLEEASAQCAIAAPVWHELTCGCSKLPAGKRRAAIQAYLNDVIARSFPILPYDTAAAYWHGVERARLDKLGRTAPFTDGQIAAIAATNSLVLVTNNLKDFANFADIKLENWSK